MRPKPLTSLSVMFLTLGLALAGCGSADEPDDERSSAADGQTSTLQLDLAGGAVASLPDGADSILGRGYDQTGSLVFGPVVIEIREDGITSFDVATSTTLLDLQVLRNGSLVATYVVHLSGLAPNQASAIAGEELELLVVVGAGPAGADGALGSTGPTDANGEAGPAGPEGDHLSGGTGGSGPTGAEGPMGLDGVSAAAYASNESPVTVTAGADYAFPDAGPISSVFDHSAGDEFFVVTEAGAYLVTANLHVTDGGASSLAIAIDGTAAVGGERELQDGSIEAVSLQVIVVLGEGQVITVRNSGAGSVAISQGAISIQKLD